MAASNTIAVVTKQIKAFQPILISPCFRTSYPVILNCQAMAKLESVVWYHPIKKTNWDSTTYQQHW